MASDTPIKPETEPTPMPDTPAAAAVAAAVPEEPALPPAVGVMETFMNLLRGIDKKVSALPSPEKIQAQWDKQNELYEKSIIGFKLEEESRQLLKIHIGDMADLRRVQKESNEKTEKLATAQDRLAETLEHINDNLKNGFALGTSVVKLFGKTTVVFLLAIVVLALVIVWVARLNIVHEDGKGHKTSITTSEAPAAPSVDFSAPHQ